MKETYWNIGILGFRQDLGNKKHHNKENGNCCLD